MTAFRYCCAGSAARPSTYRLDQARQRMPAAAPSISPAHALPQEGSTHRNRHPQERLSGVEAARPCQTSSVMSFKEKMSCASGLPGWPLEYLSLYTLVLSAPSCTTHRCSTPLYHAHPTIYTCRHPSTPSPRLTPSSWISRSPSALLCNPPHLHTVIHIFSSIHVHTSSHRSWQRCCFSLTPRHSEGSSCFAL